MVAATMISNSFLVVTILLVGSCTIPRCNGEPLFFKGFSNNRPNSGGNKYFWDIFGIFGSKNKSPSSSYGSNTISSSYGAPPSYKPTYEPPGSVKPSYAPPGPVKPSYEPPEQVKPSYKPDKPSYKPVIPSYESPPLPALPSYSTPGPLKPSYGAPVTNKPSYQPPGQSYLPPVSTKPSYNPTGSNKPLYQPAATGLSSTNPFYIPPGSTKPTYNPPADNYLPPGTSKPTTYLPSYVPGQTGRPSYVPPAISSYQPTTAPPSWPTKPGFDSGDDLPNYHGQGNVQQQSQFGNGNFQQGQFGSQGSGGQFSGNNIQQGQLSPGPGFHPPQALSPCDCSLHFATPATPTVPPQQPVTQQTYFPTLPEATTPAPSQSSVTTPRPTPSAVTTPSPPFYRPELTQLYEVPSTLSPLQPPTYTTTTDRPSTTLSSTTVVTTEINVTQDPIKDNNSDSEDFNAEVTGSSQLGNGKGNKTGRGEDFFLRLEDPKAEPASTTGDGWVPMTLQRVMEIVIGKDTQSRREELSNNNNKFERQQQLQQQQQHQQNRRPKTSSDDRNKIRPNVAPIFRGQTNLRGNDLENGRLKDLPEFRQPRTGARHMKLDNPKTRLNSLDFKVSDFEVTTVRSSSVTDLNRHNNNNINSNNRTEPTTVRFPIDPGLLEPQKKDEKVIENSTFFEPLPNPANGTILVVEGTVVPPEEIDAMKKRRLEVANQTKKIEVEENEKRNLIHGGNFDHGLNTLATLANFDPDFSPTTESSRLKSNDKSLSVRSTTEHIETFTIKKTDNSNNSRETELPISTHQNILNLLGNNDTNWVWKLKDEDEIKSENGDDQKIEFKSENQSLKDFYENYEEEEIEVLQLNPYPLDILDQSIHKDENLFEKKQNLSENKSNSSTTLSPPISTPTEPISDPVTIPSSVPSHLESDFVLLSDAWFADSNFTSTNLPTNSPTNVEFYVDTDNKAENEMIDLTVNNNNDGDDDETSKSDKGIDIKAVDEKAVVGKVVDKKIVDEKVIDQKTDDPKNVDVKNVDKNTVDKKVVDEKVSRGPKKVPEEELVVYYPINGQPFLSFPPHIEYASIVNTIKK